MAYLYMSNTHLLQLLVDEVRIPRSQVKRRQSKELGHIFLRECFFFVVMVKTSVKMVVVAVVVIVVRFMRVSVGERGILSQPEDDASPFIINIFTMGTTYATRQQKRYFSGASVIPEYRQQPPPPPPLISQHQRHGWLGGKYQPLRLAEYIPRGRFRKKNRMIFPCDPRRSMKCVSRPGQEENFE